MAGHYVAHTIDIFEHKDTMGDGRRMIAVVVNVRGSVAWLTHDATATNVYAHDSRGTRRLDQLPGGAISDLRLLADTLTWTKNGTPQAAALS